MNMDEECSSVKNKTCELPKTSKTKTTPKIFLVLLISTIVMLVTVSLLHQSMLVPLHLNLNHQISSAPDPEERQRNALVHEHHDDVAPSAEAPDDGQKLLNTTTTSDQKADESSIAWEVIPIKSSAAAHLKPVTICTCAKCGSTSLWTELFAIVQGRSFASMNYTGPPWIHNLSNKKLWTNIQAEKKKNCSSDNFKEQDSFVLIRDPKERILSAWKSKVRCDTHEDIDDHIHLVPFLLNLAGSSNITARVDSDRGFPCLDLSDFLAVLLQVHTQGKEGFLDAHFLPQHLGCFKYAPPSMWTVVTSISDPNARCSLKSVVMRSTDTSKVDTDCEMMVSYNSTMLLNLTMEDEVILDKITIKEYEMFAQYLFG